MEPQNIEQKSNQFIQSQTRNQTIKKQQRIQKTQKSSITIQRQKPKPIQQPKQGQQEKKSQVIQQTQPQPFIPKYKLGYWAVRGKAQRIRILLQYLQVPYEEVRYTLISKKQWFNQTKPQLQKINPHVSLPYLIDGDQVICQSQAIMIHICLKQQRYDLLGRNSIEKVKMQMALGVFRDLQYDFQQLCYGFYDQQNKSFQYARDQYEDEKFKPKIKMLTQIIENNDFICGMNNITYADFMLADLLQIVFFMCSRLRDDNIILNYYQKEFWKMPLIAAYVKSQRFFRRPYNEPSAVWR